MRNKTVLMKLGGKEKRGAECIVFTPCISLSMHLKLCWTPLVQMSSSFLLSHPFFPKDFSLLQASPNKACSSASDSEAELRKDTEFPGAENENDEEGRKKKKKNKRKKKKAGDGSLEMEQDPDARAAGRAVPHQALTTCWHV